MRNIRNLHRRSATYFLVTSGKNLREESAAHRRALLQSSVWKLYFIIVLPETNLIMFANRNTVMLFVQIQVNCCLPSAGFRWWEASCADTESLGRG